MKSFIILVELYSPYIPPLYTSWLNAMKTKNGKKIHITDFMYGLRHALVSLVLPREPTSAPN